MSTEEKNNFNWVYYLLGFITGILTGTIITENYIYAILGGFIGLLFTSLFVNLLVKGREY